MVWQWTEHGFIGTVLLLIPVIMGAFSFMLIGIATHTGNKGGGITAGLMLIICALMLIILIPIEFAWLSEFCK